MVKIDKFSFGLIVIGGKSYRHDVLLFPDGSVKERRGGFWKFGSHTIRKDEIEELVKANPEVLIVGTGTNGRAKVDSQAEACAGEEGIRLLVAPSPQAIKSLNQLIDEGKRISAIIHITC
jgi:hypothetical protein